MKTIIIMFLTLIGGGQVEMIAPSIDVCEAVSAALGKRERVSFEGEQVVTARCVAREVEDFQEHGGEAV